ncbi:MAG: fucose pyrophosphorylase domain-containing protein [Phycisphaerae bacterium]
MAEPAALWDYLILTASNDLQAEAYRIQLDARRRLGLLAGIGEAMVVPDPDGRRIGSGASTVLCLARVLDARLPADKRGDPATRAEALKGLRILIVHAGGDSRRLPAYSPCGKAFVPVPGEAESAVPLTLLDRQLESFMELPATGDGQVVVAAGDVLLMFDAKAVRFASDGVTALACHARPEQAARHGVFCGDSRGRVRRFLQKPSPDRQRQCGAIDRYGRTLLDVGIMSFDAETAGRLLDVCGVAPGEDGALGWSGQVGEAIETHGLDLYREFCCALGTEATADTHIADAREAGSGWDEQLLRSIHDGLSGCEFHVRTAGRCSFLHFGTTREIITSGAELLGAGGGSQVRINTEVTADGAITGEPAWVEGCHISAAVELGGDNLLTGVNADEPLSLPAGACLDVLCGQSRDGEPVWFVRCYGVDDSIKATLEEGATLCGIELTDWLKAVGADAGDVWPDDIDEKDRSVWNARLFPAMGAAGDYRDWLWMFRPDDAPRKQRRAWREQDRYSFAEMATLADQDAFHRRRSALTARRTARELPRMFRPESDFSATDLAEVLSAADGTDLPGSPPRAGELVARLISEARSLDYGESSATLEALGCPRILHTLADAVLQTADGPDVPLGDLLPGLGDLLGRPDRTWLESLSMPDVSQASVGKWCERARQAAFEIMGRTIVSTAGRRTERPRCMLRSDEIVWGRAPARLDLGGGWTDTPPYCLLHGGCVINAAVDLNSQPPIQAYARKVDEPVIRLGSIDAGIRSEITTLQDLLDFRSPTSEFALAKAALAHSGLSPETANWPDNVTLPAMLEQFGGGLELTTLAAIPRGSGLGTSSIVAAVLLAVIRRVMGIEQTQAELFRGVLRVEQALTTGGGWQDQVGGVVDGVKVVSAQPGMVVEPSVHYVPADVLDPQTNGATTLLYYTGITRLAKNILQQVVGRYLDRDRSAMHTLRRLHALPPLVADAMARKDAEQFGRYIDTAWRLNKQLDANSTNEEVEQLLDRIRPHVFGAKLLGAGGGGFLLMVCRSPQDAAAVRNMLQNEPPNDRARFFDFSISNEGLAVSVC